MRSKVRLLALIVILAIVLYPLLWMLGTSFKSPQEIASNIGLLPKHLTPGNFAAGWHKFDVGFGRFFLNSAMVAGLAVLGNTISCLLAAFAFGRLRFRFRGVFFAVMIGTLLLPGHVLIIPQYILFRSLGWVGGDWPYLPLLVPHFLATEAFFVFLIVQFMRGIPRELDEAATIDGASRSRFFLFVLIPLTRGGLAATAIFCVINSWNELLYGLILTSRNTATLPVSVPSLMTPIGTFWGQIAAVGVVTTLPMLIFALLVQKHIVRGMTGGALAGS